MTSRLLKGDRASGDDFRYFSTGEVPMFPATALTKSVQTLLWNSSDSHEPSLSCSMSVPYGISHGAHSTLNSLASAPFECNRREWSTLAQVNAQLSRAFFGFFSHRQRR